MFRIYATSEGLHFNGGLIPAFLSPAGIVVVVFVALGATAFVYWEISTVIRIAALTRQAVPFTWREVWWGSLWGFGALRGVSLPVSGMFYLGVWPLCAIGYVNSCCPPLHCLNLFMGNCAATGNWGMAVMILIPALYYLAGMLCLLRRCIWRCAGSGFLQPPAKACVHGNAVSGKTAARPGRSRPWLPPAWSG